MARKTLSAAAKAIRAAREAAGMSQEAAARLLGVSAQTVYRWEQGAPIKDRDLAALERLYKTPLGVLNAEGESLDKMVSRGTSDDGRFPITNLLRLPAIRTWLNGFQAELIERGASPEEEASVMRTVTDRGLIARFAGGAEGDRFTMDEVQRAMNNIALAARRFLSGERTIEPIPSEKRVAESAEPFAIPMPEHSRKKRRAKRASDSE